MIYLMAKNWKMNMKMSNKWLFQSIQCQQDMIHLLENSLSLMKYKERLMRSFVNKNHRLSSNAPYNTPRREAQEFLSSLCF